MFRLRRAAVTLTLGAGVVGGTVAAGVAGMSGVASATTAGSIAAATAPAINSTGSNQAAGNLTVTLTAGTVAADEYVDLTVNNSTSAPTGTGSSPICFTAAPAYTSNGVTTDAPTLATDGTTCTAGGDDTIQVEVPAQTITSPGTITLSGIAYNTQSATGDVNVWGAVDSSATDLPPGTTPADLIGTLSPYPVSNATLPAAPPGTPTISMTAATTPKIGQDATSQAAGNWTVEFSGATTAGWVSGDQVAIEVNDDASNNCSANDYVYFTSLPTVTVSTTNFGTTAAPTVTPVLAAAGTCSLAEPNVLLLQFTNTGTFPSTGTFALTVSGVDYNTGSTVATGDVSVSGTYETDTATPTVISAFQLASTTAATAGPSNASIEAVYVTANSPAVAVPPSALDAAISPVKVVEAVADQVQPGYVCLTLPSGNTFNTSSTPTVAVSSGNATVSTSAMTFETSSGGTTDDTVAFQVTGASTSGNQSTFTVSGLAVNAGTTAGAVTVDVSSAGSATTCPSYATANIGSATAYTIAVPSTQIYGADADGTAVAELEKEFPPGTECPGNNSTGTTVPTTPRPVVLATDSNYPDALAGAYLARYLGTGELLTPTASLSTETANALRQEGITNVYVVGGPIAISQAVVSQVEATDAYNCGGSAALANTLGQPVTISVTQIYGQTEYDTAQDIAEFAPASYVGRASFTGAYSGVNSSSGNGMYNDTSGTASTSPTTTAAVPTAILATGQTWQDAESASVLSYDEALPILLTTPTALSSQAQAAIAALGIQQVIVMGGPIAISNAVVTSLQGLGVSVLRIAGQDYTDTAGQLANFEVNTTTGGLGLGWNPSNTISVARGDFYTDGLAGAVDAANGGVAYTTVPGIGDTTNPTHPTPLLLTISPSSLGNYLPTFLGVAGSAGGIDGLAPTTAGDKITTLLIFGGPLAVTPSQISAMEGDL